ncbi:MAG: hypothetical protein ACRD21_21285, partial [Vicinamibacteria bacterium]
MSSLWFAAALLVAQSADSRWVPFLGCWSLVEDEVREPVLYDPEAEAGEEETAERPIGLVCLEPEGSSARILTYSGEEAFLEETLHADGQKHEATQGRCRGWQQLDWSKDGRMLFTRSELSCEEGRSRSVTGVSMLTDSSTWVELQSVGSGETRAVLVRRFRPASEEVSRLRVPSLTQDQLADSVRARARIAANRIGVEEVIEASTHVAPEVVEAVLLERGGPFPLDGETLVRLSEASVEPGIIDLMVALSFPERFAVERETGGGGVGGGGFGFGYDPFYSSAFAYPYYFAPFGYYYWYAPYNPIYVVPPIGSPGATVGRVVEGRGYTRITRVEPLDGGGRRARYRGGDWEGDGSR